MKKRLRKKKHIGEFTEWGCKLVAARNTKMNADEFKDAFIFEAIEKNGCSCGGSLSDDKVDVIVQLGTRDPESMLSKVTGWLDERSDIKNWKVGPIFDCYYDDFKDI